MVIKFEGTYKSLKTFESEPLPGFTIITGRNGSGKTQLKELFADYERYLRGEINNSKINTSPVFKRIHTEQLFIDNINTINPADKNYEITQFYNNYQKNIASIELQQIWNNLYQNDIVSNDINSFTMTDQDSIDVFRKMISYGEAVISNEDMEKAISFITTDRIPLPMRNWYVILSYIKQNIKNYEVASIVAKYWSKNYTQLTQADFLNTGIPAKYFDTNDLIHSRIENIFYNFLKRRNTNSYQYYLKKEFGKENSSVPPQEFDEQNEKPWDIINNIFDKVGLPFFFKDIAYTDFSPDATVYFGLVNRISGISVDMSSLSSGEKVIVGLIIKLFTTEFYSKNLEFPDLIFLDEPDAHLHPEMSKILINVLNDSFAKELGIHVIMTTHSPSTIALAPEGSVFQLSNIENCSLKQISIDDALKILTKGLPNLSIDYKNHRQIFVESPTDLKYYQTIFEKISSTKALTFRLYFISIGYGKGNCDQVIGIVKSLRDAGNTTSYGIVDWDEDDRNKANIFIHAKAKRYSIENFIFDPVYLAILLIECNYGKLKKYLSYSDSDDQYKLISSEKAQSAVDFILDELQTKYSSEFKNEERIDCKYGEDSIMIKIPQWFLLANGHDLKDKMMTVFEPLQKFKNKGNHALEEALINIIGKVYPLVPKETTDLLEKMTAADDE